MFGDRETGAHLYKFNWTKIQRHVLVKGSNSPDDPALADYWSSRRRKSAPATLDKTSITLAARQKGLCSLCKQALISEAEYEPDSPREWAAWFSAVSKTLNKHHFDIGGTEARTRERTFASYTQVVTASTTLAITEGPGKYDLHRGQKGLLEPDAATSGTSGSEGAGVRQRTPATRRRRAGRHELRLLVDDGGTAPGERVTLARPAR
ncbi:hypothetical protein SHIRM173S_07974 [Streptomyces hirsutus]